MPNESTFDAIVIGSGLTGGWAAKELSEAGIRVLVLEAGPARGLEETQNLECWTRERRIGAARRQPVQSRHGTYWHLNPELFVDDLDHPYSTDTDFVWIRGRQVGGRSLMWGGVCFRFSDYEFRASERDGIGVPWPLTYRDLAPFYDKVERFLGVQGSTEGLAQLPDGRFERAPNFTDTELLFKKKVEAAWDDRKVIISRGIASPVQSSGQPCRAWPCQSNLNSTLAAALRTGRASIKSDAIVAHLIVDSNTGFIKGVACIDRHRHTGFEVSARLFVLCASTLESVRILLNSQSSQHPAGVGGSSGLLGRFLCDHMALTVGGKIPNSTTMRIFPGGGPNGICIPRFRNLNGRHTDFARGYGVSGAMQRAEYEGSAIWYLDSVIEVLPGEHNYMQLDNSVDAWGIRTIKVQLAYSDNECKMRLDAKNSVREMASAAGLDVPYCETTAPGRYVHELGGARMGDNPRTSVLTPFNQCWDATNLFVSDGSCFVTAGWQNPSLTMMAITVRACDFIIGELKRGNL